ncbi:MAG: hypothetical protein FWF35_01510 [Elusimicrobia bacterium]|nr:hypothetical protein [Elusimicrobiota bacterium]
MKKLIILFLFAGLGSSLNAQSYAINKAIVENPGTSIYSSMSRSDISRVIDDNVNKILFQLETQLMKELLSDKTLSEGKDQAHGEAVQKLINQLSAELFEKMRIQTKGDFGTYIASADNLVNNIGPTAYYSAFSKILANRFSLKTNFNKEKNLNQINYEKENFILGVYNEEDRIKTVKLVSYLETYNNEMLKIIASGKKLINTNELNNIQSKLEKIDELADNAQK